MATEKIVHMNKNQDACANGSELVLETLAQMSKQREELKKLTREGLEKMNGLVRAGGQTALDLYDFGVRVTESWTAVGQEAVRNANSIAKKYAKVP